MTQGVKIKVTADSSQARSDFANLSKSVKNIEQRGEAMSKIFKGLAIGAGFMASFSTLTKAISRSSDAVIKLENSLKVVMPAGQNLKGMMQELRVVSEQTRAPIANVALTFNRLAMAMQNKVLTKDIVKVTKNIQMAAAISGATAEEANRAIRQLGQGLQGGVLRAEEYNSIIDGMPRLAKAIADGMGIPLDGLREAMLKGQLTSKEMFKAIKNETELLKQEFMQTKATIDQISALMGDEFNRALAKLGDVTGITKFIKNDLIGLRTVFKFVADNAEYYAASAKLSFLLFISETKTFFRKWKIAIGEFFSELFGPMLEKLQPITEWVKTTYEEAKKLTEKLLLFLEPISSTIKTIYNTSKAFLTDIQNLDFSAITGLKLPSLSFETLAESIKESQKNLPEFNLDWINEYISKFKLDKIDFTATKIAFPDFSSALNDFMPEGSLRTISTRIKNFLGIGEQGGGVLGFFKDLYKETFENSPWPDMWNDKGVNNPEYFTPANGVFETIRTWTNTISGIFTSLFNTVGTGWAKFSNEILYLDLPDELTTGKTDTLKTPLGSLFENLSKGWEKGKSELEQKIKDFNLEEVISKVKESTEKALQGLIDLFAIKLPVELPQGIDAGIDSSETVLKRTALGKIFFDIATSWGLDQATAYRLTETWGSSLVLLLRGTKLALTQSFNSLKDLFKTEIELPQGLDAGIDSGVYITPFGQAINTLKEEYKNFLHSILTNNVDVPGGGFVVVDSPIGVAVNETKKFLREQTREVQDLKNRFLSFAFYKQEPVDFFGDPGMATTQSSSELNDFATEVSERYDRASESLTKFKDSLVNVFTVTEKVGPQSRYTETRLANFSEIKENIEEIFVDIKINENAIKVIENLKELGVDRKASFEILFEDVTKAGEDFVNAAFKAITSFDVEELQGAGFLASAFIAAFGVKNSVTFPIKVALIPAALSSEGAQEIAGSTAEGVGKILRSIILPMSDGEADQDYVSAFISGLSKTLVLIKDRFKEGLFGEDVLKFSMPDELTTGEATTTTGNFKPDTFNEVATELGKEFAAAFGTALLAAITAGMIFPAAAGAIKKAIIEKLNPFDDGNQMTKAINGSMNRQTQPVMASAQTRGQTIGMRMSKGIKGGVKLGLVGLGIAVANSLADELDPVISNSFKLNPADTALAGFGVDLMAGAAIGAYAGGPWGALAGLFAAGIYSAYNDPRVAKALQDVPSRIYTALRDADFDDEDNTLGENLLKGIEKGIDFAIATGDFAYSGVKIFNDWGAGLSETILSGVVDGYTKSVSFLRKLNSMTPEEGIPALETFNNTVRKDGYGDAFNEFLFNTTPPWLKKMEEIARSFGDEEGFGIDLQAVSIMSDEDRALQDAIISGQETVATATATNTTAILGLTTEVRKLISPSINGSSGGGFFKDGLFQPLTMSTGGIVRGAGTETSDDIPAMLSNNEFVMNAKAVRKFGPNYLSRMNQGLMPIGLNTGSGTVGISPVDVMSGNSLVRFEKEVKRLVNSLSNKEVLGGTADATRVIDAITNELESGDPKLAGAIFQAYGEQIQASIIQGLNVEDAKKLAAGVATVLTDAEKKRIEELKKVADNVQTTFASQLANGFKTGKFGNLLGGVLDQFTSSFIDLAVGNFSKSLFDSSKLSEGLLEAFDGADLFGGMLGGGLFKKKVKKGAETAAKGTAEAVSEVASETGPLSSLWGSIKGIGEGLFEGIEGSLGGIIESGKKLLGGLFNGLMGTGGSGGLFSSITGFSFGSLLGMSQGGIVPNTSTSIAGRDSVPAMLTPGEMVLNTNQVRNLKSGSGGQQVINLTITGDISRQTKSEVIKMLPQIAAGVNANNKENNFKH